MNALGSPQPRILLVEADDDLRDLCYAFIHRMGYGNVEALADANRARASIDSMPTALLVVDLEAPEAVELVRWIRQSHPHTRIVAFCADVYRSEVRALEIPLLRKPFAARQLAQSVQTQMARP